MVAGLAGLPANTSTAIGQPPASHRNPNSIGSLAPLAVPGVTVPGQQAVTSFPVPRSPVVPHRLSDAAGPAPAPAPLDETATSPWPRAGDRRGARSRSRRSWRRVPRTAATCPWGAGAGDVKDLFPPDQGGFLEHPAQGLDLGRRPVGEIGEGAFPDLAALVLVFAQENSEWGIPVRDCIDIQGSI